MATNEEDKEEASNKTSGTAYSSQHNLFPNKSGDLLKTNNKAVFTKLKTVTDTFLDTARAKHTVLSKEIETSKDNDDRFDKSIRADLLLSGIEQAQLFKTKCETLIARGPKIEGRPARDFIDDNALAGLHEISENLLTSSTNEAKLVKDFLDKIEQSLPGNESFLNHLVSLKTLADKFIVDATKQKNKLAGEANDLQSNLLTNAIKTAKDIIEQCDDMNKNTNTLVDLRGEAFKFASPLKELREALETATTASKSEPSSWFTSNNKYSDTTKLLDAFVKDIDATFLQPLEPEQKSALRKS